MPSTLLGCADDLAASCVSEHRLDSVLGVMSSTPSPDTYAVPAGEGSLTLDMGIENRLG